ncbi:MAG: DUF364 domain-containing protein [Clostridiales bacterium]|nr:DUF364 domain-containing protein [Clostridiales bacterium]
MIIDDLVLGALSIASQRIVKDVRAGLGYTCVMLGDNSCGLAYTFRNELGECCSILSDAGGLIGKNAADIIPWAKNRNRLKAAIGLATINAVFNTPKTEWDIGNVTTALDVRPHSTFGMVGEFRPILNEVRKKTDSIYVFEQDVSEDSTLYASETIPQHLPKCDVVVVTATSLINQTIDEVLSCCGNARQVCMVGPSTPLCPEVFGKYNVHLLAGSVVTNPHKMLEIVSQGGGTMSMKPAIRQVLVKTGNS